MPLSGLIIVFATVLKLKVHCSAYEVKVGFEIPKESLKDSVGFATSAGALTLAVEKIKQDQLLPGADFK